MLRVETISDIANIINDPSLYLYCEQTEKLSLTILQHKTITDESRVKFFSMIKDQTNNIIDVAIKCTRFDYLHELHIHIKNKSREVENFMMEYHDKVDYKLYRSLHSNNDDIKRKIFKKMWSDVDDEDVKYIVYQEIKNKRNLDHIIAIEQCHSENAYKIFISLPNSLENEIAMSKNLPITNYEIYNNFVHKTNELLFLNVLRTKCIVEGFYLPKIINMILNVKEELSESSINSLRSYLILHDKAYYCIKSTNDNVLEMILKTRLTNKDNIIDVYYTDKWKKKILNYYIDGQNMTEYYLRGKKINVIEHCKSIITNDILYQILNVDNVLSCYIKLDNIDDRNMRKMMSLFPNSTEYKGERFNRKNNNILYEMFSKLGPKRISITLFMENYDTIYSYYKYVDFDIHAFKQYIIKWFLTPFIHNKIPKEIELLKQD